MITFRTCMAGSVKALANVLAILLAIYLLVLTPASIAHATIGSDDYPTSLRTASKDDVIDPWDFFNRECTSFVAWRLNNDNQLVFKNNMSGGHFGNAYQWRANAQNLNFLYNTTPAVGAVAWWGQSSLHPDGHVAYVTTVYPDGSFDTEDYNFNNLGTYATHQYRTNTSDKPNGFIHFKDIPASTATTSIASSSRTLLGNWSGDSKQDFAYATKRSDGGFDFAVFQSNGAAGIVWKNVWWTSSTAFDSTVFVPADYDGDGLTDLYYATPNPSGGFNLALMRNTGTSLAYMGQQWNPTNLSLENTRFIPGNWSGDTKGEFAYVTKRTDGSGGIDVALFQSNGGAGIAWQGVRWSDTGIKFDSTVFVPTDYDGDGYTDLYYATPGANGFTGAGFNMALMRNTGTAFNYLGQQWNPTGLSLSKTRFIPGNWSGDAKGEFAYVTKRSDDGFDLAVFESGGAAGLTWKNVWWAESGLKYDSTFFVPTDFDGDALTDVFYVTPGAGGVSGSGFNMALQRDNGSGFSWLGQQWNPSSLKMSETKFLPQS